MNRIPLGRRESDGEGVTVPKALIGPLLALIIALFPVAVMWGKVDVHINDDSRHTSVSTMESRIGRNEQDIQRTIETLEELSADVGSVLTELRTLNRTMTERRP